MTVRNKTFRSLFFFAIACMLLLSVFTYAGLSSLIASGNWVNHTTKVTLELEKMIGDLKDAETGQRGYLLTKDSRFLEPFQKGISSYQTHAENVRTLLQDNPQQQENQHALEGLASRYQQYLTSTLATSRIKAQDAESMLLGKSIMDSVRAQVNRMTELENGLLKPREKHFQKQQWLTPAMIFLLSVTSFVILIIAYWQLNDSLMNAQRLKEEVVTQRVDLEKNKELQNIFRHAPAAIAILQGPAQRFILTNQLYQELYNRTELQMLGKTFREAFPEMDGQEMADVFANVYQTGKPYASPEFPVMLKTGITETTTRYFNFIAQPLKDPSGNMDSIMIQSVDVTEQIESRKKLEDSEMRYNMMLMSSPFAICVLKGTDLVIMLANDTMKQLWAKGSNLEGKSLLEVLPELRDQPFPALLRQVYTTGITHHGYESLARIHRHGQLEDAYFNFEYQPYHEADGRISGVTVIAAEVTKEVTAKKRIEESEKEYRELADSIPQLVWKTDAKGNQIFASSRWKAFTGLDPRDEGTFQQIVHPDDLQEIIRVWTTSLAQGQSYKHEVRLKNVAGDYHWFQVHGEPIYNDGSIKHWIGAFTDINEQKAAESKLKITEARFRNLVEHAPIALCLLRGNQYIIEVANVKMLELWGRTATEMINKPVFEAMPEAAEQGFEEPLKSVYQTGKSYFANDQPFTFLRNGVHQTIYLNYVYEPIFDDASDVSGVMVVASEVTEQIMARNKIESFANELEQKVNERTFALSQSEEKFNTLFHLSPFSITLSETPTGKFVIVNENFLSTFGFSREEVIGKTSSELGLTRDNQRQVLQDELKNNGSLKNKELTLRSKNGEEIPILASTEMIAIGQQKYFLNAINDIKERKKAEEEIAEKNNKLTRMNEDLASFAYISSHDLQEPLRKIQLFSNLIIEKESQGMTDQGKKYFNRMRSAAQRMQQLIIDLLAYSQATKADFVFEKTDLNRIVNAVKEDLEEDIQSKAVLIEASDLCEANIIPFQFRQLMHNIIGNSMKFSVPGRTPHIIIMSDIGPGNKYENENLSPENIYCHISIADNGIGFDPSNKEKIFGVFQRLHGRADYEGTGIGLSIVKKIVENHKGVISAHGKPGEGATFHIFLPSED